MKSFPRIVFLDAGTVDYGDISFKELEALGDFKAYHHTWSAQIEERIKNAQIIITNKCKFDARLLSRLKTVHCIHVTATGVNNIDLEAARKNKIAVTNVSNYSTETMVQATVGVLLALASRLLELNHNVRDGSWSRSPFFVCPPSQPMREVSGKTLGIIGFGHIGRRVAQVAKALGMKVLVSRIPGKNYPRKEKVKRVSFNHLIRNSDFVTIHTPLNSLTRNLINARNIRKMKRNAFLINMARGGIVHEKALKGALISGHLAGAAFDVLTEEPPPKNHILLKAPNLILTPHTVWASLEVRKRLVHEVALNIQAFKRGKQRNRIV